MTLGYLTIFLNIFPLLCVQVCQNYRVIICDNIDLGYFDEFFNRHMFDVGAKANAWTLYPSTKGKAEEAVKALGFARTSIYRPGLLITAREETRTLEKVAQCMAGLLDRSSKASIKTEDLAKAMVFNATKKTIEGATETIEHAAILDLTKEATPTVEQS